VLTSSSPDRGHTWITLFDISIHTDARAGDGASVARSYKGAVRACTAAVPVARTRAQTGY
jgi:hypothetical protein